MATFFVFFSLLFIFSFLSTPFLMGLFLLLFCFLMVCLQCYLGASWYGYILFMVYIGGMLVTLVYVCSVSSNYSLGFNYNYVPFIAGAVLLSLEFFPSMKILEFSSFSNELIFVSYFWFYIFLALVLLIGFLSVVVILASSGSMSFGKIKTV